LSWGNVKLQLWRRLPGANQVAHSKGLINGLRSRFDRLAIVFIAYVSTAD
jgi:hypothetical protein